MLLHIARVVFILLEVLILFNLLIVVHELGHFLAARWRGLYIERFGVWFGKPIWKKTINGVQYSLGSLPFGGFVALPQLAPMDIIEGKADVDRSEGDKIEVKFERDGKVQTVWVEPYKAETRGWRRKSVRQLLIYPAETAIIDKVEPNTPAAAAGLRSGDIIRGFDKTPIYNPIALLEYISKHPNDELVLHVERGGEKFDVPVKPTLLPTNGEKKPRIGIQWDTTGIVSIQHPNPIEQVYNSVASTLNTIGAVASPKSDVKLQHLSGPVGIGRIYYLLFQSERGWQLALWFSVILNVNLAILNLLPIPVLDGGHIVLALIESVRRKPVNMRVLEVVQTSCAVLIIGYMLYVTFFDVQDLPFIRKRLDQLEPQSRAKDTQAP